MSIILGIRLAAGVCAATHVVKGAPCRDFASAPLTELQASEQFRPYCLDYRPEDCPDAWLHSAVESYRCRPTGSYEADDGSRIKQPADHYVEWTVHYAPSRCPMLLHVVAQRSLQYFTRNFATTDDTSESWLIMAQTMAPTDIGALPNAGSSGCG